MEEPHGGAAAGKVVALGISREQVHLEVFGQMFPLVLGLGGVVDHIVSTLLGEPGQQLGDYTLIGAGGLIVVFQGIGIGIARNVDQALGAHVSFLCASASGSGLRWKRDIFRSGAAAFRSSPSRDTCRAEASICCRTEANCCRRWEIWLS